MARGLFMGLGALGALSAAVTTGVIVRQQKEPPIAPTTAAIRSAAETVCIKSSVRLVEGMTRSCLSSAQYEALRDRAVLGGDGKPMALNLVGTDDNKSAAVVRTCAEYDLRIGETWYALTAADMRREEYFKRACGALRLLVDARPAAETHFANGRADAADVRSMMANEAFGFGDSVADAAFEVTEINEGVWKLTSSSNETMVYEIAHADFTGGGLGEILAYVSTGVTGGAARGGSIGLIEKPAANGPCIFMPD